MLVIIIHGVQAALAGHMAAIVYAAQLLESSGDAGGAAQFWGVAARQGHPEGQYRLGKVSLAC